MQMTMSQCDFVNAFQNSSRRDQFSTEALRAIFDYCEEIDPSMEFDLVGICCDFAECSAEDIANDYCIQVENMDADELADEVRKHLEDEGVLVDELANGNFIFRQF